MWKDHQGPIAIWVALLIVGLLFLSSLVAVAKGNFLKIVIRGGPLTSGIEVTDPSLLGFFSLSYFPNAETQKPKVGDGYIVDRYSEPSQAWDRLHSYPDATGSGGYVFYDGLINGPSEYDRKWYTASAEGDAAFRRVLPANISNPSPVMNIRGAALVALGIGIVIAGIAAIKKGRSAKAHVS